MRDYTLPGTIALGLHSEYDEEVGLGGFHIASCELDGLVDGDEVVAPFDRIEVVFEYPLGKGFRFQLTRTGGFSRRQLVAAVCATYRRIYEAEARQLTAVDGLLDEPDNRPPFGISGHALEDLVLEGIVHEGGGTYRMEVGS